MGGLTFSFSEDPATGLPRLQDPSGSLSAAALADLGRAVQGRFERLAHGPDGKLITFEDLPASVAPRQFRVTVKEREKRCPTLLLEAVEPLLPADDLSAPGMAEPVEPASFLPNHWQGQFLAEVAESLVKSVSDDLARSPLDFVLTDLRVLQRKNPRAFTLLLLSGYLYVGAVLSRRHGEDDDNGYTRAAQALIQFAQDELPAGVLDPLVLPHDGTDHPAIKVPEEEARGWLRRFFSFG